MRLQKLFTDDDAVSPVIGVILMVAITVILAAVIASFVLGLGNQSQVAPQASFSFSYDEPEANLTITHDSGDTVVASELYLRGDNFNISGDTWENTSSTTQNLGEDDPLTYWEATASGSVEGETGVVAGDELVTRAAPNYDISVVWEASEGDSSSTLGEDEGPDA